MVYLAPTPQGTLLLVAHRAAPDEAVQCEALWSDVTETQVREWLIGSADDPKMGGWLGAYEARGTNSAAW